MKKIILALCILPLLATGVKADPFAKFKANVSDAYLKPFAADLGGILGANDFNSGRAIGFPGFDAGVAVSLQAKPSPENLILRNAKVTSFGIPVAHAGAALPLIGADIMVRGIGYSGFSIVGAGLRYPVFKSGTLTMFIPDVSVSAYYDVISYDYFKGSHISLDAAASFNIPIVKPYVGVGLDKTKIEVKNVPGFNNLSGSISKPRYTFGIRLSPLPLLYIYGAYNVLHGQTGYSVGAGAKF